TVALDAMLMTRFALGLRGPAMYDGVSRETTRFIGEGNTGTVLGHLDVDGDGVYTKEDATAIARYVAGFRNEALVAGLTFNAAATRKTGALISSFISGGCVIPAATANAKRHAARLLQQGTYGATLAEIERVAALGNGEPVAMTNAWLAEQFPKTQSQFASYAKQLMNDNTVPGPYAANNPTFYRPAMVGDDQLRLRVTNALSQILVVSIANNFLLDQGYAVPSFWDMLSANVFADHNNVSNPIRDHAGNTVGNFRKMLKDTTLHPTMGKYLDMLGSTQDVPNENYARELLQLFSIGTVMLNQDGTPKLDANRKTIPSYDESIVQGFSQALTGWQYSGAGSATDTDGSEFYYYPDKDFTLAMTPWSNRRCPSDRKFPQGSTTNCDTRDALKSLPPPHSRDEKKLMKYKQVDGQTDGPYSVIAANPQPPLLAGENHLSPRVRDEVAAAARADLEKVIDNVFYHPNVGPFIARQLIQRLVTSNPTPAYIEHVAEVFNGRRTPTGTGNSLNNVRGDMREVVKAIYLHPEARDVNIAAKPWFGKLREPVNKFVHLHRAFGAVSQNGFYSNRGTGGPDKLNQSPMTAPSVFNFYSPDYAPFGPLTYPMSRPMDEATFSTRKAEPLVGPEFELVTATSIAGFANYSRTTIYKGVNENNADWWKPNYDRYIGSSNPLADRPQEMVDELDLLLTANNLKPAFKANLVALANAITRSNIADQREQRFQAVFWQIMNSADYAVQR
ncbi:MAG: DUF1800 family protein, partial [Casimicrobium sp.]